MYQKLKSFVASDIVFTSLILCVVAIIAFMLGRFSVVLVTNDQSSLSLQTAAVRSFPTSSTAIVSTSSPAVQETAGGAFVASKSGTKYHAIACPGAKQIKDENKIYFATIIEAEAAGYSRAANCKE